MTYEIRFVTRGEKWANAGKTFGVVSIDCNDIGAALAYAAQCYRISPPESQEQVHSVRIRVADAAAVGA